MKSDIKKYLSLRESLTQEKADLEERLREINQALGESAPASPRSTSTKTSTPTRTTRGRRRSAGGLSLRDAVLQVTARGPLSKEDILNGVKQLGYRFTTSNPMNSLGVILYGKNPKFKNDNGRFSPTGASAPSASTTTGGRTGKKRRKLSPEARERIAVAQRARWAKTKGGKV